MPPERGVCAGPCNARWRKARADYDKALAAYRAAAAAWAEELAAGQDVGDAPAPPAEPEITPVAGDPVWCKRCTTTIRRALAELDDLAAAIEAEADGFRSAGSRERTGSRRGSSGRSPSPAGDTLDEMYRFLTTVEDQWREARGLGTRPHRSDPEARPLCIKWLMTQLDNILAHPGSVAFGKGLLAWQHRLRELAHAEPVASGRPAVRCPRCDRRSLRRRDDGYTECARPDCGRLLNEKEYRNLAERQDGEQHREGVQT